MSKTIPTAYKPLVERLCAEWGADVAIIAGMVDKESGWNPDAVGDNGHSIGLLQLHDAGLGYGLSADLRRDPETNLRVGIGAHVAYRKEFGTVEAAIAAHNAGGPAVRNVGGKWETLYGGTVAANYVRPVLALAAEYRAGRANREQPDPETVQLNVLWGLADRVAAHGLTGTANEMRNAIVALKDHLGTR